MIFKALTLLALVGSPFQNPWGKDSDLLAPPPPAPPLELSLGTRLAEAVIHFHQRVLTAVDGPRSHFRPTSSRYMQLAVQRYGFLKGFIMGCDRLLRENEEEWIYRRVETSQGWFKYDPACLDKGSLNSAEIVFY